jgi:hypothetical protein
MSLQEIDTRIAALQAEAVELVFRDELSKTEQERLEFLDIQLPRMIRLRDACYPDEHKHAPAAPLLSVATTPSSRPSPPALQVVPYASPSATIPSPLPVSPASAAPVSSTHPVHTSGRVNDNDGRDSTTPARAVSGLALVIANVDRPSYTAAALYPTTQAAASNAPVFEDEPYSQDLAFNDFNEDEPPDDDEFDFNEDEPLDDDELDIHELLDEDS